MSRALIVLGGDRERARAINWVARAPINTRVEFKAPRRTLPQNDRMHAMLTEIAVQVPIWGGVKVGKDDWKFIFLDALKRELRLVPNLDGTGLVNLSGRSSSDLTVGEMSDLIELIQKFAAERGLDLHDPSDGSEATKTGNSGMNPKSEPTREPGMAGG
jgi:hypothetical protein